MSSHSSPHSCLVHAFIVVPEDSDDDSTHFSVGSGTSTPLTLRVDSPDTRVELLAALKEHEGSQAPSTLNLESHAVRRCITIASRARTVSMPGSPDSVKSPAKDGSGTSITARP